MRRLVLRTLHNMLDAVLVPVNRAGWPFIAIFAAMAAGLFFLVEPLGWAGVILTLWCAYFFRDPPRTTPRRGGLVISPADGVVTLIDEAVPPGELDLGGDPVPRVAVFMNVFNVHVNRFPVDGMVKRLAYRPGKFLNASLDKASTENERQGMRIEMSDGRSIGVIQIAGLVARRILCDAKENQFLKAGERFGLIRFGSRVDLYLPKGTVPQVLRGQTSVAGETVIADLFSNEEPRTGVTA